MFVGHYSAAIAAKAASPRTPLWLLIVAAQLVDIAWAILIAVGIEKVRFDDSLASNHLDLYHMPYTHSLVATLGWMAATYFALRLFATTFLSKTQCLLVALVVGSHWVLDLLVHRPDLTIAGGDKFGFGLWNLPVAALILEFALLGAAAVWLHFRYVGERRQQIGFAGFIALLVVVQLASSFGAAPDTVSLLSASAFITFISLAGVAYIIERFCRSDR